jgi:amidase
MISLLGWVGLIGKPAKQNSMGVELMLSLGVVIYVKSNIPQSMMGRNYQIVNDERFH